jgi:hypothetical protein
MEKMKESLFVKYFIDGLYIKTLKDFIVMEKIRKRIKQHGNRKETTNTIRQSD